MRKKPTLAIFALIILSSFVVLGSSPKFVTQILEGVQNNVITRAFSSGVPKENKKITDDSKMISQKNQTLPNSSSEQNTLSEKEVSTALSQLGTKSRTAKNNAVSKPAEQTEAMRWHVVFDFTRKIKNKADELRLRNEDGSLYDDYFVRQGPLSVENDLKLKQIADAYINEISPLSQRAKEIMTALKSKNMGGDSETVRQLDEIKELQRQKDLAAMNYLKLVESSLDPEAFAEFSEFVKTTFSEGRTFKTEATPLSPEGFFYDAYSWIIWDDTLQTPLITGFSELYFYGFTYGYDPSLDSYFANLTTNSLLDFGRSDGYRDIFSAEYDHPVFASNRGHNYCTLTEHYAVLYDGWMLIDEVYLDSTGVCHTVGPAPTTPTPTVPPCAVEGNCQTPTPTPTPTVSISPLDVVEKFGEKTVNVTVADNTGGTTKLNITTTNGTGAAKFENNTTELIINGNVTNQAVKIKGVLESSQVNNLLIEARLNNSTTVAKQEDFTVAVITTLEFERINTGDLAIDANPGNGQPKTNVGLRIYPDGNVPSDIDRSVIRVKAVTAPAVPNMKVYFASFDLDDPSTDAAPVDPNSLNGNDNNCYVVNSVNNCAAVGNSKSGQLLNPPTGGNCPTASVTGDVSKIECTVSGTTATTNYKLTVQPGDNFAVAASLTDSTVFDNYHNFGGILTDVDNVEVHTSGENDGVTNAGIRTQMLTVWRRLHIEKDRMTSVTTNHENGSIVVGGKVSPNQTIAVQLNINMDLSRFDYGRFVTDGRSFPVLANNANVILIRNPYPGAVSIRANAAFDLYDDDDYNNDDTAQLNGDESENIDELNNVFAYLNPVANVSQNIYTSAYVMPEYIWAAPYNNANVTFDLNVEADNTMTDDLATVLNAARNSSGNESDDFWIAYFLLGYQGAKNEDADGCRPDPANSAQCEAAPGGGTYSEGAVPGISKRTLTSTQMCDCFQLPGQTATCPLLNQPGIPNAAVCAQIPTGAFGSALYEEVQQDVVRSFLRVGTTVNSIPTTAPHELGHQFGLRGDQIRTLFGFMDYSVLPAQNALTLHDEHINLIRKRVHSPGQ